MCDDPEDDPDNLCYDPKDDPDNLCDDPKEDPDKINAFSFMNAADSKPNAFPFMQ